jgi:hypothetical protein
MKKLDAKKLRLSSEAIRHLQKRQLSAAAGGWLPYETMGPCAIEVPSGRVGGNC